MKTSKMTRHHVPPKSRSKRCFILKKPWRLHQAYHALFRNAASFSECIGILYLNWLDFPVTFRREFAAIFGQALTFTECVEILRRDWWTPR